MSITNFNSITQDKSVYANYRTINQKYGLSRSFLNDLVQDGKVQSIKLKPTKSAQRLYKIPDIENQITILEAEMEVRA